MLVAGIDPMFGHALGGACGLLPQLAHWWDHPGVDARIGGAMQGPTKGASARMAWCSKKEPLQSKQAASNRSRVPVPTLSHTVTLMSPPSLA
eukprot:scaffold184742_cov17-Tisochrysis_lutea.AAC.1